MTDRKKGELRIVNGLLQALETGDYPALKDAESRIRSLKDRLEKGEAGLLKDEESLGTLFRNPGIASEAVVAVGEETMKFLNEQLDRFREIKRKRPFTEDERKFNSDVLGPLISSLSRLIDKSLGETTKKDPPQGSA